MDSATVIVDFQCKLSGQYFPVGSIYVGEPDRIKHLVDIGFVEGAAADAVTPSVTEDLQVEEVIENVTTEKRKDSSKNKPE